MRDPKVRETIFTNMRRDSIKLVHRESNEPVFKRETTQLGERGERALNESPNAAHEESKMEIDPEEATLQVDSQAYEELKADGRTCPVHVYVSTADADSCCASRLLESLMCSGGMPCSAYPVGGYQERQNLGDKLPKDGQNRSIVLINCGGTENVKELLSASRAATDPTRSSLPISNEALSLRQTPSL